MAAGACSGPSPVFVIASDKTVDDAGREGVSIADEISWLRASSLSIDYVRDKTLTHHVRDDATSAHA